MLNEREKEIFGRFVQSRYSMLVEKAKQKAICFLNGGNMPKKARIPALQRDPRYPDLVEKYKKDLDAFDVLTWKDSEEYPDEFVENLMNTSDYRTFRIKNENEEERKERKRKEKEERERIKHIEERIDEYFESPEFEALAEKAQAETTEKLIEEAKEHFLTLSSLEYTEDDYSSSSYNWYSYDNKKVVETDDVEEFLKAITAYDETLESDYLEYVCDVDYYSCGVCNILEDTANPDFASDLNATEEETSQMIFEKLTEVVADNGYEETALTNACKYFSHDKIMELLSKNPYVKRLMVAKEEELRILKETENSILDHIPDKYIDLYPRARHMKRHFTLHVGPTNSGKTYDAIKALEKAESGAYLAPLRLLAYEQYERMNADGVKCSMLTGEERIDVDGANIVASTIEMANYSTEYDVVVIDEAQMISDVSRGGSWTSAILGILAKEIHVCMSADAEKLIVRLIEECGETYEIIHHERKTPLICENTEFHYPKNVKKGDALIVFTRRNVHSVAAELQRKGYKCSVIYGALPYDVRHEQAELFATGQTDIVVATDAIGMGMNLPIRRVVFLEQVKYDGMEKRKLLPSEYKQIAGRAGRLGMYDEGYTAVCNDRKWFKKALESKEEPLSLAVISFPEVLLGIDADLSTIIERWINMDVQDGYRKAVADRELLLCKEMEGYTDDKKFIYNFITIPYNEEDVTLHEIWKHMYRCELEGNVFPIKNNIPDVFGELERLEQSYRICDLLYTYSDRFGHPEHIEEIQKRKMELAEKIASELAKKKLTDRKCKYCGKILSWNYPYGMCNECHDQMYPPRRKNWYDDDYNDWY